MDPLMEALNEEEVRQGNLDDSGECVIEWLRHSDRATVGLTKGDRLYSRMQKLAEKYPEDIDMKYSTDGYLVAHIPRTWVKIRAPRELTEETKEKLRENMKKVHAARNVE